MSDDDLDSNLLSLLSVMPEQFSVSEMLKKINTTAPNVKWEAVYKGLLRLRPEHLHRRGVDNDAPRAFAKVKR